MEIGDIFIYVYMICETIINSVGMVLTTWMELSVSHFKNVVTTGNKLFSIQSSGYGITTVAKVSLFSTSTWADLENLKGSLFLASI